MGGVLALLGVKADRMYDGLDKYNDLFSACTRLREHAIFFHSLFLAYLQHSLPHSLPSN